MVFGDTGHLNAAAYSFLEALREVPGHQDADEAVDTLEHMVEGSKDLDHVLVALGSKHILKAFQTQNWEGVFQSGPFDSPGDTIDIPYII